MGKVFYYGQKTEVAFSFKTKNNSQIQPSISTWDNQPLLWKCSDGQIYQTNSPTFNFSDATEKTIEVLGDPSQVKDMLGFHSIDLTYIDLFRLTRLEGRILLYDNTELISFISPVNVGNITDIILTNTAIETIDLENTIVVNADLYLNTHVPLASLIQPQLLWQCDKLILGENNIQGDLDLSLGWFRGSIQINYSNLLSGIRFNTNLPYIYITNLDLSNNPSLTFVDLAVLSGILTPQDSQILLNNIGASQIEVDRMLYRLNLITSYSAHARSIDLRSNQSPSADGLYERSLLLAKNINVLLDWEVKLRGTPYNDVLYGDPDTYFDSDPNLFYLKLEYFEYEDVNTVSFPILASQGITGSPTHHFYLAYDKFTKELIAEFKKGTQTQNIAIFIGEIPSAAKIEVRGNSGNYQILMDDVVLVTEAQSVVLDLTQLDIWPITIGAATQSVVPNTQDHLKMGISSFSAGSNNWIFNQEPGATFYSDTAKPIRLMSDANTEGAYQVPQGNAAIPDTHKLNFDLAYKDHVFFGRQNWVDYTAPDEIEVVFEAPISTDLMTVFSQGNRTYFRQRWAINVRNGNIEIDFYTADSIIAHNYTIKTKVLLKFSSIAGIGGTVQIYVDGILKDTLSGISIAFLQTDFHVPVLGARHYDFTDHPGVGSSIQGVNQFFTGSIYHARMNDKYIALNTGFGNRVDVPNALPGEIRTIHTDGISYINSIMWAAI